jgi:hypothetical protein
MAGRNPQFYEIPDVAYNSIPRMPTSEVNRIALEELKTRLDPTTGKVISDNIADLSKNMPGLSIDSIVSSASMGMNSKTPGMQQLASADGIAQLQKSGEEIALLKDSVKEKGGVRDTLYGFLKGFTRGAFATFNAPVQYAESLARRAYARAHGETPTTNPLPFANPDVTFNQLWADFLDDGQVDSGSGFFVDPNSSVGRAQAEAASAYGKINGEAFTFGRFAANGVGIDPNTNAYNIVSGSIDAIKTIALDPSTYIPGGALPKVFRGISKSEEALKAAVGFAEKVTEADKLPTVVSQSLDELQKASATAGETAANLAEARLFAKGREIETAAFEDLDKARLINTKDAETFDDIKMTSDSIKGSKVLQKAFSPQNVAKIVEKVSKDDPAAVSATAGRLKADTDNAKTLFDGQVFTDNAIAPITSRNQNVVFGARGDKTLLVGWGAKEQPNLISLTDKIHDFQFGDSLVDENGLTLAQFLFTRFEQNLKSTKRYDKAVKKEVLQSMETLLANPEATFDDIFKYLHTELADDFGVEFVAALSNIGFDGVQGVRSIWGKEGGFVYFNGPGIVYRSIPLDQIASKEVDSAVPFLDATTDIDNLLSEAKQVRANSRLGVKDAEKTYKDRAALANETKKLGRQVAKDKRNITKLSQQYEEALKTEAGVADYLDEGMKLDRDMAAKFFLGKKGQMLAKAIAIYTGNPERIWRLFGTKIDFNLAQELSTAKNADEVLNKLITFIGKNPEKVSEPLQVGILGNRYFGAVGQLAKLEKQGIAMPTVAQLDTKLIKLSERLSKAYGRNFRNVAILQLDDIDSVARGLDDWMKIAGYSERAITTTLNGYGLLKTNAERSNFLLTKLDELMKNLATKEGLDPEVAQNLNVRSLILKRDREVASNYFVGREAVNGLPEVFMGNGINQAIPFFPHQLLDDVFMLPSSKELQKAVLKAKELRLKHGVAVASDWVNSEFGDRWRSLQLAFRASYVLRNLGEMQVRQYLAGHSSVLNHPLGYVAMAISNPKGNAMQRLASKISKYDNNVFGKNFNVDLTDDIADEGTAALAEYQTFMTRHMSRFDPRIAKVASQVWKDIKYGEKDFHRYLGEEISRLRTDPIIRVVADGVPQRFLETLPAGISREDAIFEYFKNGPGKVHIDTMKGVSVADDAGVKPFERIFATDDGLRQYLFDPQYSVSAAIKLVTGNNPELIELLAKGKTTLADGTLLALPKVMTQNAKGVKIINKNGLNKFGQELAAADSKLNMKNIVTKGKIEDSVITGKGAIGSYDKAIDLFFKGSNFVENKFSLGPEYRMQYWDYVARYSGLLGVEDLRKLKLEADKSLLTLKIGNVPITLSNKKGVYKTIENALAKAEKSGAKGTLSLREVDNMAAARASDAVKDLFYDAAKQKNFLFALRIIFPFANAQFNTLQKWVELAVQNPVKVYRAGTLLRGLQQPGSSNIYNIFGMNHDNQQGFLYKDESTGELSFKYPIAGSLLGGLLSAVPGAPDIKDLQLSSTFQNLNIAFSGVSPFVPGFGPMAQIPVSILEMDKGFGMLPTAIRTYVTPYVKTEATTLDYVLPSWMNKLVGGILGTDATLKTARKTAPWANYLASTGEYGDNPFADEATKTKLFKDAARIARWDQVFTALFQSALPAAPRKVINNLTKDGTFMSQTALYQAFTSIRTEKYPDSYDAAVVEFANTFGIKNILSIMSVTEGGPSKPTDEAYSFLEKYGDKAAAYVEGPTDIVPLLFPGGEFSREYFKFQSGRRRGLTTAELEDGATRLVYEAALSQIRQAQIDNEYTDDWFQGQQQQLKNMFGGAEPIGTTRVGTRQNKLVELRKAIADPIFKDSPIYNETVLFLSAYDNAVSQANNLGFSSEEPLKLKDWQVESFRNDLNNLAQQLITSNPKFNILFQSVFAKSLEVNK